MSTYICTYVHAYTHTYIRTYIRTTHIYTYVHIYIHTYLHTLLHWYKITKCKKFCCDQDSNLGFCGHNARYLPLYYHSSCKEWQKLCYLNHFHDIIILHCNTMYHRLVTIVMSFIQIPITCYTCSYNGLTPVICF